MNTVKLRRILKEIQLLSEQEINKDDVYRCTVCGREVKILKKGQGPLICCMKQMVEKEKNNG